MDEDNSKEELNNEQVPIEENTNPEVVNKVTNIEKNKEVNKTVNKVTYEKIKEKKGKKNKRKGDSGVYVEYRKPSIFTSILLILIGALMATIALLLVYVFKIKNDVVVYEEPKEQEVVEEESKEEKVELDLNINGEFVKSLYEKIPAFYRGYEPYYSGVTKYEDISDNTRLLYILLTLDENNDYKSIVGDESVLSKLDNKMMGVDGPIKEAKKFDFSKVEKLYKSVFGSSNNVPLIDAETGMGLVYEYVEEDNCFYGHFYAGGGGSAFVPFSKIKECEQNEDGTEVYIYDNFIAFDMEQNLDGGENPFALYKSADTYYNGNQNKMQKIVDLKVTGFDEATGESIYNDKPLNTIIEEYQDQAGRFKHTFKLDKDGNYYWYSSEQVN